MSNRLAGKVAVVTGGSSGIGLAAVRQIGANATAVLGDVSPIDTDMKPADGPQASALKGMIAVGRYGRGAEVAALVAYLAGPEAAYVTGADLRIDGGFAA